VWGLAPLGDTAEQVVGNFERSLCEVRIRPAMPPSAEHEAPLLERLACDVLLTPHPGASAFWERAGTALDGLVDPDGCRRYAAAVRKQLEKRLAREKHERRSREGGLATVADSVEGRPSRSN
jgi:hypothetical protein